VDINRNILSEERQELAYQFIEKYSFVNKDTRWHYSYKNRKVAS